VTVTTDVTILRVDPKNIHPDPTNPRKKLRAIDELAANVKIHGVLDAITVRPDTKSGHYIIVKGERRHRAALRAGVADMPVIVDTAHNQKELAQHRMIENVQRDDLTAVEHAIGVQGLFDLGMTEAEIAAGLSLGVEQVKVSRVVAASKAVAVVGKKLDLTFDQAAGLAEFEDHKDVVKDLTKILVERPAQFTQTLERYRKHLAEAKLIADEAEKWEAKGYRVLSENQVWNNVKFVPIRRLRTKAKAKTPTALTSAELSKIEGRAVQIGTNFAGTKVEVEEGCIDPAKHGLVDAWAGSNSNGGTAVEKTDKEKEAEGLKRRTHLAAINAGRAAEVVRRDFVRSLLKRKISPKGTERFVTETVVMRYQRIESPTDMFADLTGMALGGLAKDGSPQTRYVKTLTDKNVLLGLVAYAAAGLEGDWAPNTWENGNEHRVRYLKYLVSCGYEPSVVERTLLGGKASDVLAESDRIKAAAKAAKPTAAKKRAPVGNAAKSVPAKRVPAKKVAKRRAPARRVARR
jgi:ParB family transcriptional regulator, chromosome partitioning protein